LGVALGKWGSGVWVLGAVFFAGRVGLRALWDNGKTEEWQGHRSLSNQCSIIEPTES
jgi:hypothetical protein